MKQRVESMCFRVSLGWLLSLLKGALAVSISMVFLGFLSRPAFAQAAGSTSVSGTVQDPSGASVPVAKVVLTDVARDENRASVTNDAGRFLFPNVPPATYTLRVTKAGFQTYLLEKFQVEVGQRADLNVALKVGSVSSAVTVSGEGVALLQTESNTLGTVVQSRSIEALPLNGRDFLQLALLAGGTAPANSTADGMIGQTDRSGNYVDLGGTESWYTEYLIDGIVVRGTRATELTVELSPADIDQFKVQQSFFMADQGPNPAIVNINTKSGTNALHGEAFEFVRNDALDSRNYFSPGVDNLHRNQFGGAVGGPIRKDRLWFFGNYEGNRQIDDTAQSGYTPTAAMFQGDFNQLSQTIYDPTTYSAATGTRAAFPNNEIPQARINPVSEKLLKYYLPGSSLTQLPSNIFTTLGTTTMENQGGMRVDASLTPSQTLFGQFIDSRSNIDQNGLFHFTGAFFPEYSELGMLQYTSIMRPNLVSTIRLGVVRNLSQDDNDASNGGPTAASLGIANTDQSVGVPRVGFSNYTGFGRSAGSLGNIDNVYQLDEGFNYIRAAHNLQFGASIRYYRTWQQNANANALGSLGFQPTYTAQLQPNAQGTVSPVANTGNAFADFLLGMPTTGGVQGLPSIPYRFTQFMPYIQDTWKVTPRFTLNYGVSWFKATVPNPQGTYRKWVHGFNYSTGLLTYEALNQVSPELIAPENSSFAPRLGFAWQPRFLRRTVVRAGAGIYYDDLALSIVQLDMSAPPFTTALNINNNINAPLPQYVLGTNIFPPPLNPLAPITSTYAASLSGVAPFLMNPNARTPYQQQWNFSVQHTLSNNDLVEVDYMGMTGHRGFNRYDENQCGVPVTNLYCNRATRPYPQYTGLLTGDFNGNTTYNALVASFDHRFSKGLSAELEYTYGKSFTGNEGSDSEISSDVALEKGPSYFDVRQRAVFNVIYHLPVGKGQHYDANMGRALDMAVGGWTATSIVTFSTGVPFAVTAPNTTRSSYTTTRPNRVCNGRDSALSGNLRTDGLKYFNTACWVTPPVGYFGSSTRDPLYGPGVNNWDIGIEKIFPVTERVKLQFRCEMFNAFNHAQFGNPNGNIASSSFGLVSTANTPRNIQLALKLLF